MKIGKKDVERSTEEFSGKEGRRDIEGRNYIRLLNEERKDGISTFGS